MFPPSTFYKVGRASGPVLGAVLAHVLASVGGTIQFDGGALLFYFIRVRGDVRVLVALRDGVLQAHGLALRWRRRFRVLVPVITDFACWLVLINAIPPGLPWGRGEMAMSPPRCARLLRWCTLLRGSQSVWSSNVSQAGTGISGR